MLPQKIVMTLIIKYWPSSSKYYDIEEIHNIEINHYPYSI